MSEADTLELPRFPNHVAIIMDGNGRWAKQRGLPRIEGHRAGGESIRKVISIALQKKIRYLTLFTFSTENWQRSQSEVATLMEFLSYHLRNEVGEFLAHGTRLRAIGDFSRLPEEVLRELENTLEATKHCAVLDLVLAVSYGGREDIVAAAKRIAELVQNGRAQPDDINSHFFANCLSTAGIPDPDLLIRTSGEQRISNFMLWQLAYSEIVVTPVYWPEFDESEFLRCLGEFQHRERRFGLTSEQIQKLNGRGVPFTF